MDYDFYSFSGIVYHINESKKTDKGFYVQSIVVLKTKSYKGKKYRNYNTFTAVGKKVEQISDVKKGDYVDIFFTLNGTRWQKDDGDPVFFNQLRIQKCINRGRAYILDPGTKEGEDETEGEITPNKEFRDPIERKGKKEKQQPVQNDLPLEDYPEEEGGNDEVPF